MRSLLWSGACVLAVAASAGAQHEIVAHDGTIEFVSRGANATNAKTLLQRVPADQIGGAAALSAANVLLQDQNFNTAETVALEIRRNNPAGPAAGSPDMSAAGLIGTTGNLNLQFPTPPTGVVSGVFVTITLAAPVAVPSSTSQSVPGDDIYYGVAFGPSPSWPATDGISAGGSGVATGNPGEQMNPNATGYSGTVGAAGCGWQADITLATAPSLATSNRAWTFTSRWTNATLQPYAHNATVFTGNPTTLAGPGLNPNYGYAGFWPWMQRPTGPDNIGYRARASVPVGTTAQVFIGVVPAAAPLSVFGVDGKFCLDPSFPFIFLETKATVAPPAGQPAGVSQVEFGPYPGSASLPTGVSVYAQAVLFPAVGNPVLTSMCKLTL